ncbi:GDP-mannose 4,6-dehydratase [Candidatus Pelagibacter sp.]|nr:GDP-mannose 4,6-dehydratase [Candidatus Pelagibacter sp.]
MKKAFILGSTGQDGSYMCELLLKKKYKVYALIRKSATGNTKNIDHLINNKKILDKNFCLVKGDLNDHNSIRNIISYVEPDEIYNFADQDHVGWSFAIPSYSLTTTAHSLINILEAIKSTNKDIRYFHPLSSNMFGKVNTKKQNEKTPFNPQSVYAISKATCFHLSNLYRDVYGLKIYNSIFYNHESPRRSEEYVTRKIAKHVAEIFHNKRSILELGDISAKIDWGYAKEYVEYAYKIMQTKKPDVFVVATGKAHSVKEFAQKCFRYVGLDYKKYLKTNKKFLRPAKTGVLIGDTSKIKKVMNFEIRYDLDKIIKIMMDHELNFLK